MFIHNMAIKHMSMYALVQDRLAFQQTERRPALHGLLELSPLMEAFKSSRFEVYCIVTCHRFLELRGLARKATLKGGPGPKQLTLTRPATALLLLITLSDHNTR